VKIYLAHKYHADSKNRAEIESLCDHLTALGHEVFCVVRDVEKWGALHFSAQELMERSFKLLDSCDTVLIELSEKGVGVGIEAGYAFARGIPIQVIAKKGSDISTTLQGIARRVTFYSAVSEVQLIE
jgi:nucleoside 2-deoxyribosyltransferase